MRIAYLLPDTNLFLQCKELRQLDWSAWKEYDEIHIIVTRPVQKEIDKLKNQGNVRRASRARKATGLFREILQSDTDYQSIEKDGKEIKTFLKLQLKPDEALRDQLDFGVPPVVRVDA